MTARPTTAVILAGGGGGRATPRSSIRNKCLFPVHDHTLIAGQIAIIRDQLSITDLIVVVGHLKEQVKAELGDGSSLGVSIRYVEVSRVEDGPGAGLLEARPLLTAPFFLFLGDECHFDSKHHRLLDYVDRQPDVLFTYTRTINPNQIRASFGIETAAGDHVVRIEEKPARVVNDLCGCGTLYLTPRVLDALAVAAPSPRTGRKELWEVAASFIGRGKVFGVDLDDPDYVNVNTVEDLHRANLTYHTRNFDRYSISVIIPAWNEAESIEWVIKDFARHPRVTEILVMDNLSEDGTGAIAEQHGAKVIARRYVGYGDAVHAGLCAASGDILVVTEADYTFRAADLPKLLEYLKDADAVIGTRTAPPLLSRNADMSVPARLANVFLAKYLEVLWLSLEPRFSDIGCSYRAIWREQWHEVKNAMTCKGPAFTVEMMIEIIKAQLRCLEVPVSYHRRFGGESKHCQTFAGLARTGWAMGWMITSRRLRDWARLILDRPRESS